MTHPLRGRAAVVGIGSAGCGEAPGRTPNELMAEAALAAIADAGLALHDIDGVFAATSASYALDLGASDFAAVLIGAVGAVGGGVLRDVLVNEVPLLLRRDLYAVPALLGSLAVVLAAGQVQTEGPEAGLHVRADQPTIQAYYEGVLGRLRGSRWLLAVDSAVERHFALNAVGEIGQELVAQRKAEQQAASAYREPIERQRHLEAIEVPDSQP